MSTILWIITSGLLMIVRRIVRTRRALLLPFAAGNLLYIAAADLIPEIKHHGHPARSVALFKVRHGGQIIRVRVGVDHVGNRDTPFTPLPSLIATANLRASSL